MRRSLIALALGLFAAAVLASAALAKEGGVELSSTPYGTPPGGNWSTGLTLIDLNGRLPADAKPTLELTNLDTGERRVFAATSTGEIGQYTLDVVFPTPGRYVLRHRVNVERVLRESDYGNNSAETPFELSWSQSGTPTVVAVYKS